MLLRRERPGDEPAIDVIHHRAFDALGTYDGPPVEDALVRALRADPGWVPGLSIVAEDATGEVVGHVVATRGSLSGATAVGIGPLGVLPEHQGRGIGAALMHAVIAATDALGHPVAALLGDPGYYARFGFVPGATLGIVGSDPGWGPHFQVRTLTSYDGTRGTFRYAAPFDDL